MIVLEGDQPLGDDAHRFYDEMVDKLEADTTTRRARSGLLGRPADGSRRAEQRRQGRVCAGVSRRQYGRGAVQRVGRGGPAIRRRANSPTRSQGLRDRRVGAVADQQIASDRSVRIIEFVTFAVIITMLLLVYRSIRTVLLVLVMVFLTLVGHSRRGGVPGLPRPDRAVDVRDQPSRHARDRRGDRLCDLPHRALPGSAHDRRRPRVGLLHDVSRHRACGAGLGHDDRRRDLLPVVHPTALLPVAGRPAGGRHDRPRCSSR